MKMEEPMKKQMLAVAGAVLLSVVAAGECQAQSRPLDVSVPFTFEAGDKTLPAGNYRVEYVQTGAGSLEILRSNSGDVRLMISTMTTASSPATAAPALVFHRYANRYFLAQILTGDGHARELFPSRREKELARSQTRTDIALLAPVVKP